MASKPTEKQNVEVLELAQVVEHMTTNVQRSAFCPLLSCHLSTAGMALGVLSITLKYLAQIDHLRPVKGIPY